MLTDIRSQFGALKATRRKGDPLPFLSSVGTAAADCIKLLVQHCQLHEVAWRGIGKKRYGTFALADSDDKFSRAINLDLFIGDPDIFLQHWLTLLQALKQASGSFILNGMDADAVSRLYYTAVISFAAASDVFSTGDRGGPGTFFEMAVGPTIEILTGRPERGQILIPVPGQPDKTDKVPVDLSFFGAEGHTVLVVPTKISTRERISQAYVHQAILNRIVDQRFVSVLCVGNENNMFVEKGASRSATSASVKDTLVADTISMYQRYIAELSGLYYLDPPVPYSEVRADFPQVRPFVALLTGDLMQLLA